MARFFVPKSAISESRAVITGGDCGHIVKVLRLGPGDELELCDGLGTDYSGQIVFANHTEVVVEIKESHSSSAEPAVRVTLFQGLPKGAKMDYIIEKCVELGVDSIVPVLTKRTVVKLDGNAAEKKTQRWQNISEAAAKQSGRGMIPQVQAPVPLKKLEQAAGALDLLIVAYENEEETHLKDVLRGCAGVKRVGVVIGPEGGFDFSEIELLTAIGAKQVSLGKRILRTETAGHTVMAALMYETNEF